MAKASEHDRGEVSSPPGKIWQSRAGVEKGEQGMSWDSPLLAGPACTSPRSASGMPSPARVHNPLRAAALALLSLKTLCTPTHGVPQILVIV